ATLRRVCLLVDSRHGLKEVDGPVLGLLDAAGVSYQIVLTKTDKLNAGELARNAERVVTELARHTAAYPEVHLTSAVDRFGLAALRATLSSFALGVPTVAAASSPS